MQKIDNVCYCNCHKLGKGRCPECRMFHLSTEGVLTHPNDKSNPNYDLEAGEEANE